MDAEGEFDLSISEVLDNTFEEVDSYLTGAHGIYSGCTAIVALVRPEMRAKGSGQEQSVFTLRPSVPPH